MRRKREVGLKKTIRPLIFHIEFVVAMCVLSFLLGTVPDSVFSPPFCRGTT